MTPKIEFTFDPPAERPRSTLALDLESALATWNRCGLASSRLATIANRLDDAAAVLKALDGWHPDQAVVDPIPLQADAPTSPEEREAVAQWLAMMQAPDEVTGKPAPGPERPPAPRRGRPELPELDGFVAKIGAAFEELTGRKPARANREGPRGYGTEMRRQGEFLAFARTVASLYGLPESVTSDQRLKAVTAARKRSRMVL